jgi:hypothetical protein
MSAPRELGAERDRRESVAGVAEGGEQKAAPKFAQSISASSRIMRVPRSGSNARTVTSIDPTPASR